MTALGHNRSGSSGGQNGDMVAGAEEEGEGLGEEIETIKKGTKMMKVVPMRVETRQQ